MDLQDLFIGGPPHLSYRLINRQHLFGSVWGEQSERTTGIIRTMNEPLLRRGCFCVPSPLICKGEAVPLVFISASTDAAAGGPAAGAAADAGGEAQFSSFRFF